MMLQVEIYVNIVAPSVNSSEITGYSLPHRLRISYERVRVADVIGILRGYEVGGSQKMTVFVERRTKRQRSKRKDQRKITQKKWRKTLPTLPYFS